MDENKSINPENNTQNKEKKKYNGFFKDLWNSIFKIEKYPELATKGVPRALIYLIKLVAIFSIIFGDFSITSLVIKKVAFSICLSFKSVRSGVIFPPSIVILKVKAIR